MPPASPWTADDVGRRLIAAFRRLPDHPVMSRGQSFTEEDGHEVEPFGWPGRFVADLRDWRMLMTWASCRATGASVAERYRELGWQRSNPERRRRNALAAIAAGLNRGDRGEMAARLCPCLLRREAERSVSGAFMSSAMIEPVNTFEINAGTFRGTARPTGHPPRPEMARCVMDVETVLIGAFRDELPKDRGTGGEHGPGGYKCPLGNIGTLGTRVDNWSREPGYPAALGGPHPDALKVEAAVEALAGLAGQAIDDAPDLVPDFGAIGPLDEVAAVRRALCMMPAIVARCAKTGRRLPWRPRTWPERIETGNGRPMVAKWKTVASRTCDEREVDEQELVPVTASGGTDAYSWDSFCPLVYEPTLQSIAEERAEYLV